MKLDHELSSDILQYACCQNFTNIAFNILCKYFDRKETFDTLPTDCKQRLYGQTLLWIVKGSKFALFKEGLTLLRLLQAAHSNLCREKDWEKLELGIKLKIILQQMLSGCSSSQCLETFHGLFPAINDIPSEDETQTDRSLPFLLCQLIKQPSERNSISKDSNFQTEVGAKLIHTITHRVKHLIKNLKWKLPTPSFSKVVKTKLSEEERKIYHLLEESSLSSNQLLVFLQLRADIDEEKMFQTVQRLFDGRGREVKDRSVCNRSERLQRSPSEEEEEEEDHQLHVMHKPSGNSTKKIERETTVTCERSAMKYEVTGDPSSEDVKIECGSTRRERNSFVSPIMHLESSYVNPDSETDLINSCMDSKLVVVLKKLNLPVRHVTEVGRNDTECPLLCSVRSSEPPSDRSLVLLGDSSPILSGERSPPLWSDESSILSSDRSPTFLNETHCVANEGIGSFDSPKSSWDNTNNLERKGRMKGEIAQDGSKVRRVSECSSDSVEYFCNSRLNSIQKPKLTVSKENINFAKDMPFNRRVSLEEESGFRDRKDRSINAVSDSQKERQICRDIRNVTQNSSEEKEESVSSSGSKSDSGNHRRGSKEPFVVRSFYSQSLGQLENYKWRSDHRRVKRKHSANSSNVRLSRSNYHSLATDDGLGAAVQQIRNKMSRNGAYTLPCGNWQRSNANSKKKRVDSSSKETFWSCSLDNPHSSFFSGVGELTNSPVFEYRYTSSESSSNQSLSLLTGRRVLFSNGQDGSNEVHTCEKEPEYSEDRSPILLSSSSCDNSNNAIKSDFSLDELRFIAESQSKEIADAGQRGLVATTPTSRKSLVRSDIVSNSSSEFQNAQRSHTPDESYGTEETVPDSDEEEGGEHSGRQSYSHHRFPSLVQYLNIHEASSTLRPCSVVLEKLKLEEMRLRILLSQET
ncbi:uncharacterized protein [Apostichopus japonicus]|uniref:uncharacterized protein isoform X2 n=1 Tax=Stichopus japonicus TaxID=307972 RepID=UPI003AB2CF3C